MFISTLTHLALTCFGMSSRKIPGGPLAWRGSLINVGDTNRSRSLQFSLCYYWERDAILGKHYSVVITAFVAWKDMDVVSSKGTLFHFFVHVRHYCFFIISTCSKCSVIMLHLCRNRDSYSQQSQMHVE